MRVLRILAGIPIGVLLLVHVLPFLLLAAPKAVSKGVYETPPDDAVVRGWPARAIGVLLLSLVPIMLAFLVVSSRAEEADEFVIALAFAFCTALAGIVVLSDLFRVSVSKAVAADPGAKPWNRPKS